MARTKVSEITKRGKGKGNRRVPSVKLAPVDSEKPARKPPRSRPGVRAMQAMRKERMKTKPVFAYSCTRRAARIELQNFDFIRTKSGGSIRISPAAVQALRLYLEYKTIQLLQMSKTILLTGPRKRIRDTELRAVMAIRSQDGS